MSAKTARNANKLAEITVIACPTAKRAKSVTVPCDPSTANGKSAKDAAFVTMVKRPEIAAIAARFAKKMDGNEIGRCTRLAKSRLSGNIASHRHSAAAPVTVIDSTIKKYSSGIVAVKGSKT